MSDTATVVPEPPPSRGPILDALDGLVAIRCAYDRLLAGVRIIAGPPRPANNDHEDDGA